ncbi:MAG TPA: hypothetical protein VK666_06465, partial [Chryseolinea sp.]|nr:hypothetical protein [Chryseolinea sp.]
MNKYLTFILFFFASTKAYPQLLGNPHSIVYAMDIQPETNLVVAALDRNRIEVWNYKTKKLIREWPMTTQVNAVKFLDNVLVAALTDGYVEMYDTTRFERVAHERVSSAPLIYLTRLETGFAASDELGNVFILAD